MNQHDPNLIAKIQWLKRACDLDDEAFLISLESETDFHEQCEWFIQAIVELEAFSASVGELIKSYNTKQDRIDGRVEWMRRMLLNLMEQSGQRQLKYPCATASVSYPTHGKVVVSDILAVPDGFVVTDRKPLKTLIGEQLKAGQDVPGCHLSNPEPRLTIRVK